MCLRGRRRIKIKPQECHHQSDEARADDDNDDGDSDNDHPTTEAQTLTVKKDLSGRLFDQDISPNPRGEGGRRGGGLVGLSTKTAHTNQPEIMALVLDSRDLE